MCRGGRHGHRDWEKTHNVSYAVSEMGERAVLLPCTVDCQSQQETMAEGSHHDFEAEQDGKTFTVQQLRPKKKFCSNPLDVESLVFTINFKERQDYQHEKHTAQF